MNPLIMLSTEVIHLSIRPFVGVIIAQFITIVGAHLTDEIFSPSNLNDLLGLMYLFYHFLVGVFLRS